jgi:DNA-binding MarR family transcriptional regulator
MKRRADLAAMIEPLRRALLDAEGEILADHDTKMWAYAVLLGLGMKPVRTQAALADAIGADRTRIIAILDDLQDRGLITREPDPADRRARLVALTSSGMQLRDSIQDAIQRREDRLLATLKASDRTGFLNALRQLSAAPVRELLAGETDPGSRS